MTKDKKGITLVSLVVTIIVMLIIFGVATASGTILLDNSRKMKIESTLYLAKGRAEVLLEQYMFDEDVSSLIKYKNNRTVVGYTATDNTYFSIRGTNNKIVRNSSFENLIRYTIYKTLFNGNVNDGEYTEVVKQVTKNNPDGTAEENQYNLSRYLFLKWGVDECISQGIMKKDEKDAIVNNKDYIIVVFDFATGKADVAYSKGYLANGKMSYTLDSILNIDNTK